MDNDGVDLIVKKSLDKRTLLEKYDIAVENLSYEYITDCKNTKEIERIILILRSGEEGYYPDLLKHAEERLTFMKPDSIILRTVRPVITRNMLEKDKRQELDTDINEWMKHMHLREKDLNDGRLLNQDETVPHPDIRKIPIKSHSDKKSCNKKINRIKSYDYESWDKYDADTELNKIDLKEEQIQNYAKRNQQKQNEYKKKMSRESIINKSILIGTELCVMADEEREKGNEAFKAGDYEEALQFYNSCLTIDSTINGYNNRAITYIKLRRFNDAIDDCNKVLAMDYTNIKALLRRALALQELKMNDKALIDYETVRKLQPNNKIAISAINKLQISRELKKVRIKITEDCKKLDNEKIIDISNNEIKKQYEICFCDRAPTSSQYTTPLPHKKTNYCCDNPSKYIDNNEKQYPKSQSIFTSVEKSIKYMDKLSSNNIDKSQSFNSMTNVKQCHNNNDKMNFSRGDNTENEFNIIINSPYEFICVWQSLRTDIDLKLHAQLLRSLGPDNLKSVIGNNLDGEMFSTILHCLNQYFSKSNDAIILQNFLMALSQLKRFNIISMFMDKMDKEALINMISFLNNEQVPLIHNLCIAYNI